jgi:hypothetical protein
MSISQAVDNTIGWHRLPSFLGIPVLFGIRNRLRQLNLFDRGDGQPPLHEEPGEWVRFRSPDGRFNDLASPRMGSVGSRFGRNVPLACTDPEGPPGILSPDPFDVSSKLLVRDRFKDVNLNVLTAAWIQFEVHDWVDHGMPEGDDPWDPQRPDWPGDGMRIKHTRPDPHPDRRIGASPAFASEDTHWWDASQIYGRDTRWLDAVRDEHRDGKLKAPEQLLAGLGQLVDPAGTAANLWVGSLALCALFALEHNAICDALTRHERRAWNSDELFHTARLVNAALIAKIHWLEWSTIILDHPALRRGLRMNWWGALEPITKRWGRLGRGDFLFGIPGSATEHHGAPYSLTEEFVAVYRMHWLMPDEYSFASATGRRFSREFELLDLIGPANAATAMEQIGGVGHAGVENALYSLGMARAGAPGLHNFPTSLQNFVRTDAAGTKERIDLAAVDVLRDRERGVPRYNLFRQLFHLQPVRSFEQLTTDLRWAEEISDVYEGDIDQVDLQVGLLVEPRPRGFAISDTAFRVFLLMASRRLKSDRFFTSDYNRRTYTPTGMDWIKTNTLKSVLLRHFPSLEPALRGVDNPFLPWQSLDR